MGLEVIGGGLGRTGTASLKAALEHLLGAPCYHMFETFGRPDHLEVWAAAERGEEPDWDAFFTGYAAAIDWPAVAFWRELVTQYPDALVVLSLRESPDAWWRSMERTIVDATARPAANTEQARRREIMNGILDRRFTPGWRDRDTAIAAYRRHNDAVRAAVPPERLVEWRPSDGWEPLCAGLERPVPNLPFPHLNTTQEFRSASGLDG